MNGEIGGTVIKPDQMQIANPLLILILVPLFESLIYPLVEKCGNFTPLKRIGCGMIFCGLGFVVSGIVELQLEVDQLFRFKVFSLVVVNVLETNDDNLIKIHGLNTANV